MNHLNYNFVGNFSLFRSNQIALLKHSLPVFLMLFFSAIAFSQTWEKTFETDIPNQRWSISDNNAGRFDFVSTKKSDYDYGYDLCNDDYFVKTILQIGEDGTTLLPVMTDTLFYLDSMEEKPSIALLADDGGYLTLTGHYVDFQNNMVVKKIDVNGNQEWETFTHGFSSEHIFVTKQGGLLFEENYSTDGDGSFHYHVVDGDGNLGVSLDGTDLFGVNGSAEYDRIENPIDEIYETDDGHFLMFGNTYTFILDDDGFVLDGYSRWFALLTDDNGSIRRMQMFPESIYPGKVFPIDQYHFLGRRGNELKRYGFTGTASFWTAILPDGFDLEFTRMNGDGYVFLVGNQSALGGLEKHFMVINMNVYTGEIVWSRDYGMGYYSEVEDLISTDDGGFVAIAKGGFDTNENDIYIVRADEQGNVLSQPNTISGYVYHDVNADCSYQETDEVVSNCRIEINGVKQYLLKTDNSGHFTAQVESGDYFTNMVVPDDSWVPCFDGFDSHFEGSGAVDTFVYLAKDTCPEIHYDFVVDHSCGSGNGSIQVNVTGGNGNYAYQWENGDTSNSISNLAAGNYKISIYDNNCLTEDSVDITFPVVFLPEWTEQFEDGDDIISMANCADGGNLLLYEKLSTEEGFGELDFYVIKTDEAGNRLWNKYYGNAEVNRSKQIRAASDGGFLIMGTSTNTKGYVIKADDDGNVEWETIIENDVTSFYPITLVNDADGGFLLIGYEKEGDTKNTEVVKLNSSGVVLMKKNYPMAEEHFPSDIIRLDDGYLIAGTSTIVGTATKNPFTMKIDLNGNMLWHHIDDIVLYNHNIRLAKVPDGGYLRVMHSGWRDVIIRKYATDTTVVWTKTMEISDEFRSLTVTSEGMILYLTHDVYYEPASIHLTNLTFDGEVVWNTVIYEKSYCQDILLKPSGKLIISGSFKSGHYSHKTRLRGFSVPYVREDFLPEYETHCARNDYMYNVTSPISDMNALTWEDGSSSNPRTVNTVSDTVYYAVVETSDGCQVADASYVTFHDIGPKFHVEDANCGMDNGSIVLRNYIPNSVDFEWDNGYTEKERYQLSTGSYSLTLTDDVCSQDYDFDIDVWEAPVSRSNLGFSAGYNTGMDLNYGGVSFIKKGAFQAYYTNIDSMGYDIYLRVKYFPSHGVIEESVTYPDIKESLPFADDTELLFCYDRLVKYNENREELASYLVQADKIKIFGDSIIYLVGSSADLPDGHGAEDIWIKKIDKNLNVIWSKSFGGSNEDKVYSFDVNDNKIVILASSQSADYDVPGNNGDVDIWVLQLTHDGDLLSSQTFGGSDSDNARSVALADDGRCVVSANSKSNDFDVPEHQLGFEGWLLFFDNNLNLQWSKIFEGDYGSLVSLWEKNKLLFFEETGCHVLSLAGEELSETEIHGTVLDVIDDEVYLYCKENYHNEYLQKVNENGEMVWSKKLPKEDGIKIVSMGDGNFIVGYGKTQIEEVPYNPNYYFYSSHLVKLQKATFPPEINLGSDTTICQGDTLTIDIGDYPGYYIHWSNGDSGQEAQITEPGYYTATISGIPSCENEDDILVDFCEPFQFSIVKMECGRTLVSAVFDGGQYFWSNGSHYKNTNISEPDSITCTIIYPNGDSVSSTQWVDVIVNNIVVYYDIVEPQQGESDGSITANVLGGMPPYEIEWNVASTNQLPPGDYIISVTDANGCIFTETVTLNEVVGIDDLTNINRISVMPNPSNDIFHLRFNLLTETIVDIDIRNVLGQKIDVSWQNKVQAEGWHEWTIEAHDWQPGTYLITIKTTKGEIVRRLVKI